MKTLLAALAILSATGTTALAEDWHLFSSNSTTAYLADVDSIAVVDGLTTMRIARVRKAPGNPDDLSHVVDDYAFRCSDRQVRFLSAREYGPDGALIDQFEEPEAPWDEIGRSSFYDYMQAVACGGDRAPQSQTWPSLQAFMTSGRGN